MKKIVSLLLTAALFSFVAVSCKKYEEGPTFSLASKKGRVAGEWSAEKATAVEDGSSTDVTEMFKAYFGDVEFTKDGDFKLTVDGSTATGTWEFDDKKENIVISVEGETWKWEILRLKQKELWVKWVVDESSPNQYLEIQFEQ